jgi:hypothetical protein
LKHFGKDHRVSKDCAPAQSIDQYSTNLPLGFQACICGNHVAGGEIAGIGIDYSPTFRTISGGD